MTKNSRCLESRAYLYKMPSRGLNDCEHERTVQRDGRMNPIFELYNMYDRTGMNRDPFVFTKDYFSVSTNQCMCLKMTFVKLLVNLN